MELTSGTGIKCDKCHKEVEIVAGVIGTFFAQSVIERLKNEGGTIKGQCGHQISVKPKPKPEGKIKKVFQRLFK